MLEKNIKALIERYEYDSIGFDEINNQYSISTPNRYLPQPLKDYINKYFSVQYDGKSLMVFRCR